MFGRRPDGTLVRDVADVRRIVPYLMRGRNESAVYFEQTIDLTKVEAFLDAYNAAHPDRRATLFHVVAWAAAKVLDRRPRMNRFVAGGRLWQRDGIWISFSAKKRLDDEGTMFVVKRRFDPAASFAETVAFMYGDIVEGRSDVPSHTDKELGLLLKLPGPGLRLLLAAERGLDRLGLLPKWFTEPDPMFCSAFIANLGSLKMDAAYHHLYEYGNCPIFCVIGRTHETPVVVRDGKKSKVAVGRVATLRWTFDERIEDGLYAQRCLQMLASIVEDPAAADD